jgi:hypothetical protein
LLYFFADPYTEFNNITSFADLTPFGLFFYFFFIITPRHISNNITSSADLTPFGLFFYFFFIWVYKNKLKIIIKFIMQEYQINDITEELSEGCKNNGKFINKFIDIAFNKDNKQMYLFANNESTLPYFSGAQQPDGKYCLICKNGLYITPDYPDKFEKDIRAFMENVGKECAICYEVIKRSIYCATCHNCICDNCLQKVDVCPFCRMELWESDEVKEERKELSKLIKQRFRIRQKKRRQTLKKKMLKKQTSN